MSLKSKCFTCNKKYISYQCKCLKVFCITHLSSIEHKCTYNYKNEERIRLHKELQVIRKPCFDKLE